MKSTVAAVSGFVIVLLITGCGSSGNADRAHSPQPENASTQRQLAMEQKHIAELQRELDMVTAVLKASRADQAKVIQELESNRG